MKLCKSDVLFGVVPFALFALVLTILVGPTVSSSESWLSLLKLLPFYIGVLFLVHVWPGKQLREWYERRRTGER